MRAVELLTGTATAPGSTLTAVTTAVGNSMEVRHASPNSKIKLVQAWVFSQADGILRIRSPHFHDNVQGMRMRHELGAPYPLLPEMFAQDIHNDDNLTVELSGSGTAGDIETACLLLFYEDLPGINGNFIDAEQAMKGMKSLLTVENTITAGANGGYSGEEAINAEFDLLKSQVNYALLGYSVSQDCAAVRYRGVDIGNLGVGGPGNAAHKNLTANWFARMSKWLDAPLIPVLNAANAPGILLDVAQNEDAAAVTVTSYLAEL